MSSLGAGCQLIFDARQKELLVVAGDGLVQIVDGQGSRSELIDASPDGPSNLQWILGLSLIGSAVYAYGMCRQVYRRLDDARWQRVDEGIRTRDVAGIKSMCGADEHEVYAVGFGGEIWVRAGGRWRAVDSPTNVKLEQIAGTAKGDFVICGGAGTVLRGREFSWTHLPQDHVGETIWSVVEFDGTVYMSTTTRLMMLNGDILEDVAGLPADARSFGYLAKGQKSMWSIGHSDLLRFDGQAWARIAPPPQA
ncbi:hypothetical protein QTI66_34480 [Variovorax sp. J22R133]|uniref:hypothetical protein n=1 Tax=Variovorax brevis TaxID=3053503 RepID=UPI0025750CBC|nr:hypothetical protein [Variovorax sp. J22R133]MDM0117229.1 hypothetical protein [Variovorax sp. J22R133]